MDHTLPIHKASSGLVFLILNTRTVVTAVTLRLCTALKIFRSGKLVCLLFSLLIIFRSYSKNRMYIISHFYH